VKMKKDSKIYVAGHRGLVGSAVVRKLESDGYFNILKKTREELDLTDQYKVRKFFNEEKPKFVFLAAAKVGGIGANSRFQADFLRENILIQTNIIDSAYRNNCNKLLFLGSSCIYPKFSEQPIKESSLMSGLLEPTNSAYAIAKIAGIEMCQKYNEQYGFNAISLMPTNLYGINDNFDIDSGHVLPALISKFIFAKKNNLDSVKCWGTGSPYREFLFVDDLADAAVWAMNNYNDSAILNVGTGKDITIKELSETIKNLVGFDGSIIWDSSQPDGTPRKLLDVSRINGFGWKYKTELIEGIKKTIEWYNKYN
jgi:GDP-L-fucose synthase